MAQLASSCVRMQTGFPGQCWELAGGGGVLVKLAWAACVAGWRCKALSWAWSAAAMYSPLISSLFQDKHACSSLKVCASAFAPMLVPSVAILRDLKVVISNMC